MKLKNKDAIIQIIYTDEWMMGVLKTVRSLHLPDWWICAGFVRSKIWDVLHEFERRTTTQDIDVVYFDRENIDESEEKRLEKVLHDSMPTIPWSVKNEARMHILNNTKPYTSAEDAIAKFPETATSIGMKLDENDQLLITAPHGVDDVLNCFVCPTPYFLGNDILMKTYHQRKYDKNWSATWKLVRYSN